MLKLILSIFIITLSASTLAQSKSIYIIQKKDQELADEYFKKGNYEEARSLYFQLAGAGDKYAQYILSIMELQGLNGKPSLIKAYSWAKVAKENNSPQLVAHYKKLAALVPSNREDEFIEASSEIYEKYSNLGVAKKYLRYLRDDFPKCTGSLSRVSVSACERIRVVCNASAIRPSMIPDYAGNDRCLEFVAKIRPENLKRMKKDINQLQDYVEKQEQKKTSVIIKEENK
ncbi:SEL1-like repeat protein [Kangiella sediminilitoris]|uniref:Sel1 domain protein repeat-containing protein n=1 Tax=Kangiella sediminilitoris TaxID=1144748 RepID=A0A1B3BBT6_9GAMM|nr:hypothetical protein [Kangiella sediminilitoris]AOE50264.1 Sel1 domain protein repeat-containing protein [Kangiella sediminilitoris]